MIIFLYGPDTFRSRQKLNEIVERYKKIHQSGLNLRYFDGENLDFQNFKNEVTTTSMFHEKKLIVLEDIFSNKNFKEEFLKNKEVFIKSDNIILFWEKGKIVVNDPLFKFLKKNSKSQEFQLLKGQKLRNWIKKEFENQNTKISLPALEKLIAFLGNNLWQLSNEIKKLVSYKNKQKIEIEDVKLLVRPEIETDIFETIDALASKNKKKALSLLHQHLEKGDNPLYLLTMINFQFRNLLIIKDLIQKYRSPLVLSKITNLHPYVVKKSYSQIQKFKIEELKKIYQKIFQADFNIKTGKVNPKTALDMLIAEI